jgi:hypothetical protein
MLIPSPSTDCLFVYLCAIGSVDQAIKARLILVGLFYLPRGTARHIENLLLAQISSRIMPTVSSFVFKAAGVLVD